MNATGKAIAAEFHKTFNNEMAGLVFCPGRVNLIGEHLDYNGGKVLPAAIDRGIFLGYAENNLHNHRFFSAIDNEIVEVNIDLNNEKYQELSGYVRYPVAVMLAYPGFSIEKGYDFLIRSDLPAGAGLSSSAALELAFAYFLNPAIEQSPEARIEAVKACQKAENQYIGVQCGIMDQFAVAFGRENQAMLLDTQSLDYQYVQMNLPEDVVLCLINSKKSRELENSAYNDRKVECDTAFEFLNRKFNIESLSEATLDMLPLLAAREDLEKRVKHVITETKRVQDAVKVLEKNDFNAFGQLLCESHSSLKTDFQVSCEELDFIENYARNFSPCLGCRMTGAGFGGSLVALIESESFDSFKKQLELNYKERFGYACEVFRVVASNGVHRLQ